MDLIDVTLRDGGHAVNFNWPTEIVREYYNLISSIDAVTYIEMGYWKQTAKSNNRFYNLNMDCLIDIIGDNPAKETSIMIDYHYCNRNLDEYPKNDQNVVGMIRVCSRKTDIDDSLPFVQSLKDHTGLKVSLNIFNASNYSKEELEEVARKVAYFNLDYVYFADTHGSLDFEIDKDRFTDAVSILRDKEINVGMHLHDHRGKAYSNFKMLANMGFTGFDASTRGMGKGVGNLKLENVVGNKDLVNIMKFVSKYEDQFTMRESPYGLITAKHSITDYYGYNAEKKGISIEDFNNICSNIKGIDKDVYNENLLENVK